MIELHRLDNSKLLINVDLIESIEEIPDTVITLSNGKKYILREDAEDIITKMVKFKTKMRVKGLIREGRIRRSDYVKVALSN